MSSRKSLEERFWSKVDTSAGPDKCWIWTGALSGSTGASFGGEQRRFGHIAVNGKMKVAARVVLELSGVQLLPSMQVCHHCDNSVCVNPSHLFVGTRGDNMRDKVAKGRNYTKGKSYTAEDIREVHRMRMRGATQVEISKVIGCTASHVGHVLLGRCRRDIYEEFHGVQEQAA